MAQRAIKEVPLLWIGKNPIPQLCGAEGEGNQGQQGSNGDGSQQGQGQQQGQQNNGNGSQSGTGDQSGNGQQSGQTGNVSKAEFDALQARMAQADRRAQAAEAKVQEYEGKGKTELEQAQAKVTQLEAQVADLIAQGKNRNVTNEFLTVKDAPTWHDNGAALKLLDHSLLTIEDDGTVKGMKAAVDKLAKDHPYLVKKAEDAGNGGQGGQQQNSGNGGQQQNSGAGNNGSGGGTAGPDQQALAKRFPAMRGRVRS